MLDREKRRSLTTRASTWSSRIKKSSSCSCHSCKWYSPKQRGLERRWTPGRFQRGWLPSTKISLIIFFSLAWIWPLRSGTKNSWDHLSRRESITIMQAWSTASSPRSKPKMAGTTKVRWESCSSSPCSPSPPTHTCPSTRISSFTCSSPEHTHLLTP